MKKEKSCGVVVLRQLKEKEEIKVLLIHHVLGHWGFPKGHVEKGETEEETAKREVFEETGIITSVISGIKEQITYQPKENVEKDVIFFLGFEEEGRLTPQVGETTETKFVSLKDALSLLTHEDEKNAFKKLLSQAKITI